MDSWVAIAAGAAGYISKRWQSPPREKRVSSDLTGQLQDKSIPVKRLNRGFRNPDENVVSSRDNWISDDSNLSEATIVSTPCDNKQVNDVNMYNDCDLHSILSLMPPYSKIIEINGDFDEYRASVDVLDQRSPRSSLQFIRPSSSIENCLTVAQFCKGHIGMENHFLYSPAQSSTVTVKPLRKSNSFGRKIGDVLQRLHKQKSPLGQETIFGLPPLSNVEVARNTEVKKVDKQLTNSMCACETGENRKNPDLLAGYSEAASIFTLGVSVGLISSFLVNKNELNKLNGLLKQTENLVEDLQEELELKDSLTVKELAIEDQDSQDMHDSNNSELREQKNEEHLEAMSKIEAELQAELEWLELSVGYSNPHAKSSDLDENQDLILGLAEGELRAEMFGWKSGSQPFADRDGSGVSTPYSVNYAVSPRELSLRLHKVIESRLEERISELETALERSERKLQLTKPQHEISSESDELRPFSWCLDFSSPVVKKKEEEEGTENDVEQASVISLSEEEGYADMKMKNDTESSSRSKKAIDGLMEDNILCNGDDDDGDDWLNWNLGDESVNICFPDDENLLELDNLNLDVVDSEEEEEDYEELLIIKQIVEKTRKDSSALLSAKKALFSMDQTQQWDY
ncbi:uncharacterized protein LOC124916535 [Impatiens glandulifera]|uniref:uncharacterized protein LOC124916535 n=1 Tax=Impatiens glandulifera TaxID=253017 RepID=UPI001FB180BF|nr:uncharacterized protein LOC124916535 [Impatiens glandulifera]